MQRWSETPCTHSSKQPPQCDDEAGIAAQCKLLFHDKNACCAGQFWRNTNWFMTGMVLAWVSITIGYVVVRATQSLKGLSTGLLIYGIWVLVVEVRPLPCPALPCPALPCPALPCPAPPCPSCALLCRTAPGYAVRACLICVISSKQAYMSAQSVMSQSPASRITDHHLPPSPSAFFFSGAGSHNIDAVRCALDGACAQV